MALVLHLIMPTTRRRHVITESDELTAALHDAARIWPEDAHRPGKLMARLLQEGHKAIQGEQQRALAARLAAIDSAAGSMNDIYGSGYLESLRDEWPE